MVFSCGALIALKNEWWQSVTTLRYVTRRAGRLRYVRKTRMHCTYAGELELRRTGEWSEWGWDMFMSGVLIKLHECKSVIYGLFLLNIQLHTNQVILRKKVESCYTISKFFLSLIRTVIISRLGKEDFDCVTVKFTWTLMTLCSILMTLPPLIGSQFS